MSDQIHSCTYFQRLREHLDFFRDSHPQVDVVGIFLYGSQNYGLATPESDVDTKLIVLPTLEDLIFHRAPMSTTLSLPNGEQIDVKDIRLMFDNYRKQNINFLETIFTPWHQINAEYMSAFRRILNAREAIARMDEIRGANALFGMMMNKHKMLTKPSPATADAIEKFGYDPKQLVHIHRLAEFMERFYIGRETMESALHCSDPAALIAEKQGRVDKPSALILAEELMSSTKIRVNEFIASAPAPDPKVNDIMDSVLMDIMTQSLRGELSL